MGYFKPEYKKSKGAISHNNRQGLAKVNRMKRKQSNNPKLDRIHEQDAVIAQELGLKPKEYKNKQKPEIEKLTKQFKMLDYPLPEVYKQLDNYDTSRAISRQELFNVMSRTTPYLIKRLLYESAEESNTGAVRVMAAKVLLDKVLPNVSATDINLSSEDIQSLVIVKTNKTR